MYLHLYLGVSIFPSENSREKSTSIDNSVQLLSQLTQIIFSVEPNPTLTLVTIGTEVCKEILTAQGKSKTLMCK